MKSNAFDALGVITLSRATLRMMYHNLWWAASDNTHSVGGDRTNMGKDKQAIHRSRYARVWLAAPLAALAFAACVSIPSFMRRGGTAWGIGAFDTNGEQIYLTGVSQRSGRITYRGGPAFAGGMMMGTSSLACASCHGPDGRGGVHTMMMQAMNAPDIRWSTLVSGEAAGYTLEDFRLAVETGKDPDGSSMSPDMPRWDLGSQDLADLADYLKTLR